MRADSPCNTIRPTSLPLAVRAGVTWVTGGRREGGSVEKAIMRSGYFGTGEEPCPCCAGHTNLRLQSYILRVVLKSLELVKMVGFIWTGIGQFYCICGVPPVG